MLKNSIPFSQGTACFIQVPCIFCISSEVTATRGKKHLLVHCICSQPTNCDFYGTLLKLFNVERACKVQSKKPNTFLLLFFEKLY